MEEQKLVEMIRDTCEDKKAKQAFYGGVACRHKHVKPILLALFSSLFPFFVILFILPN